ncbi:PIG-L family deacetylase [Edaphobacter albus]|uniref:PIG-L family deacetylase n=1 Tax=Edaphobacter sp. 4G125 TaxID=2763071 RepID=UPI0016475A6C|nr:PIG-L family deacetylase [Edaphobacter sp. 4G125]QNI37548.1 PIG-L family deacetylase [Edaphobacter sp. 4G125]
MNIFRRLICAVLIPALSSGAMLYAAEVKPHVDAEAIAPDQGAAATWQALKRLHTRASLLMIVAHPDDEDGATLAYESRGVGARVSLLTLDRGEGGANVMSSDYWDALGLVRTEELLQADRYYGLDAQYFTSMADYGFSKSLNEALGQWGHDRVLEQAVRVVRTVRPLIVCSVFVGGPTDGHGQHATAGLMAQEVFKAAGDPKMFPEQIKEGLLPWSPVKTYARVPFFRVSEKGMYDYANHTWGPVGVTNHITGKWEPGKPSVTVSVPSGTFDTVIGQTYTQISHEGLGFQRSQNGGPNVPLSGSLMSDYHRFGSTIDSKPTEESFFDGVDVSLTGITDLAGNQAPQSLRSGLSEINSLIEKAITEFSAAKPAAIAPDLAQGKKRLEVLIGEVEKSALSNPAKDNVLYELRVKDRQFNDALVAALQISLNADVTVGGKDDPMMAMFRGAQSTFQMATPGLSFPVKVHLYQPSVSSLAINSVSLKGTSGKNWDVKGPTAPTQVNATKAVEVTYSVQVPEDEPFTRPYFTRDGLQNAFYEVAKDAPRNKPFSPYPLQAEAELNYEGTSIQLASVVQVVSRVNGPGLLRYPMPVGPALSVALSPAAGVIPLGSQSTTVSVRVRNNVQGAAEPVVRLALPSGWSATPDSIPIHFTQTGEEQTVSFSVKPKAAEGAQYTVTAVASLSGKEYREGYTTVGYVGLRPYFLYAPAKYTTVGTDVKMAPGESIAYVEGSGDDVPSALEQIGVHVTHLSAQDLASGNLQKYDAIVLGVRAYAVRPDLIANNARLLQYVEKGGVVIVQYNTPEYDHNYGPYPYVMSGDPEEVTDEKSVVKILAPNNPVFNWPNKITEKDFDGWIEERGSKFLQSWDPKYTPLLETHDAGQPEQKGGLVYARYGKGVYIYNAYAFYRQLPLGVPGAFRLFANMLSLPKNPEIH